MDTDRALLRRAAMELLGASWVVLMQELAFIRWLPGQVRVLAYFPNLILISAFLGLGIGSLRVGRRSLLWLWPLALLAVTASAFGMSQVAFTQQSVSEHLWLLYFDLPQDALVVDGVRIPIVGMFVLSAVSFAPLGQIVAERLMVFRQHSSSLWGYCWDIGGSLLGVITFAVAGMLGLFPIVWMAAFAGIGLVLFAPRDWRLGVFTALIAGALAIVVVAERSEYYSPYYAVRLEAEDPKTGFIVVTNGSYHQLAAPLDKASPPLSANHARTINGYHAPYGLLGRPPGRVLVLGAGTGNDVAVALDEGATHVDAVEIDPVIAKLGDHHPNKPYQDERVTLHVTDARSHLNTTDQTYDLIVFGTLDSMTRLSALSNVRLDNFVYTQNCIDAARSRLSENGGMVLLFSVGEVNFIDQRLTVMLASAFKELPRVSRERNQHFNRAYLAGPAFAHLPPPAMGEDLDELIAQTQVPTDDWPYLYLAAPGVSGFYLSLMAIFLILGVAGVMWASPELRRSLRHKGGVDLEMFLFGVAFLLLETRGVTEMNLVWGATWLTSSVVFGAILLMVLLATIIMQLKPMPWSVALGGVIVSLLATYLIDTGTLLTSSWTARLVMSVLFVGAPIFFASACFALRFKVRESPGLAFGWNLLGAVVGGLLEFLSMALGLKTLLLLALVAYLGVALLRQSDVARPAHSG